MAGSRAALVGLVAVGLWLGGATAGRAADQVMTAEQIAQKLTASRSLGKPAKVDLPSVTFEYASAKLTGQAEKQLDELAKALDFPAFKNVPFTVAGHTDARGPDGLQSAVVGGARRVGADLSRDQARFPGHANRGRGLWQEPAAARPAADGTRPATGRDQPEAVTPGRPTLGQALGIGAFLVVVGLTAGFGAVAGERILSADEIARRLQSGDEVVVPSPPIVGAAQILDELRQTAGGMEPMSLPAITFVPGSAALTTTAKRQLDQLASALRDPAVVQRRVAFVGQGDATGKPAKGQRLAGQRAAALKSYLVHDGIAAARLDASGAAAAAQGSSDVELTPTVVEIRLES